MRSFIPLKFARFAFKTQPEGMRQFFNRPNLTLNA